MVIKQTPKFDIAWFSTYPRPFCPRVLVNGNEHSNRVERYLCLKLVFTSATFTTPSDPGRRFVILPILHFNGGNLVSFFKTNLPS